MQIGNHMKRCPKCQETKPVADFHKNKRNADGLTSYCKPCWNEYTRQQAVKHRDRKNAQNAKYEREHAEERRAYRAAWRKANAERIKARNAAYREANRETLRAKGREYAAANRGRLKAQYAANPEPAKERARRWQLANAERVRQKNRNWREANPDKYREHMRLGRSRRRARLASLPDYVITTGDVRRLLAGPCAVADCANTDIQIDHIIPIARGGSHGIGNLQPLCSSHNQSKGARLWIEFRVHLALKERLAA
jgi:5-methylcytosine-specific restriction endonuclease McrA